MYPAQQEERRSVRRQVHTTWSANELLGDCRWTVTVQSACSCPAGYFRHPQGITKTRGLQMRNPSTDHQNPSCERGRGEVETRDVMQGEWHDAAVEQSQTTSAALLVLVRSQPKKERTINKAQHWLFSLIKKFFNACHCCIA